MVALVRNYSHFSDNSIFTGFDAIRRILGSPRISSGGSGGPHKYFTFGNGFINVAHHLDR